MSNDSIWVYFFCMSTELVQYFVYFAKYSHAIKMSQQRDLDLAWFKNKAWQEVPQNLSFILIQILCKNTCMHPCIFMLVTGRNRGRFLQQKYEWMKIMRILFLHDEYLPTLWRLLIVQFYWFSVNSCRTAL